MNVEPFQPSHLTRMRMQPHQALSVTDAKYVELLAQSGESYTVSTGETVLICGGIAKGLWETGTLWAFVAADIGAHFTAVHRVALRLLTLAGLPRIEASSECTFEQGCRWLEMLGFEQEGRMRRYGPDGADHYRYARVL